MAERTFKIDDPPMRGDDVRAWKTTLNRQMKTWRVDLRLPLTDEYDHAARSLTASVCHGLGLASASSAMKNGVTPELRVKLRNKRLTAAEKKRFDDRADWRRDFRERHKRRKVSPPLRRILQSSWGWAPKTGPNAGKVHDGVDLTCANTSEPLLAMCRAEVVRADAGGWWGKSPSGDVSLGDGIVIIRALEDAGPIKKGMNLCYGHAEHARVRPGDVVEPGEVIALAGLAVIPHTHFMVNKRSDDRGRGELDPMPLVRYAIAHGS